MAKTSKTEQNGTRTGTVTPPIPPANLEKLEKLYSFRGRDEVVDFIQEHPFLVPVLLEAPEKIKPYFGETPLFLEINFDPEDARLNSLILVIITTLKRKIAFDKEDQLEADWLLDLPFEVRMSLLLETRDPNEI